MGIVPSQRGSHPTGESCTLVLNSKHSRLSLGKEGTLWTCPSFQNMPCIPAETGPHGEHGSEHPRDPCGWALCLPSQTLNQHH